MNIRMTVLPALILFATLVLPVPANAMQGVLNAYVQTVLVSSSPLPPPAKTGLYYGGCMAYLSNPINTATNSPNCPNKWVSFSCDGTYASKDIAQIMLDQAQLALSLNKLVSIVVDDTMLSNGYCTAVRIDVYR